MGVGAGGGDREGGRGRGEEGDLAAASEVGGQRESVGGAEGEVGKRGGGAVRGRG